MYDPMAGITNRETQDPYRDFHKAETALRVYRDGPDSIPHCITITASHANHR
jgi:hypothetical protein